MSVREDSTRYYNFRNRLVGTMLAIGAVASVSIGGVAIDRHTERDNAQQAWIAQDTRNEFWRNLAGSPVRGAQGEDGLAADLVARTRGKNASARAEVLEKFEATEGSDGWSIYRAASSRLDEPVFTESDDEGRLTKRFQSRVLQALGGDLENLVIEQGPKPPLGTRDRGPHPLTLALIALVASTAGYVVAACQDKVVDRSYYYDEGTPYASRRSWLMNGVGDLPKLQVGVLAPHIAGVFVLTGVVKWGLDRLTAPLQSVIATYRERSALKTAMLRAELQSVQSRQHTQSDLRAHGMEDAFLQARQILEQLEALPERTPTIEAAIGRARAVVEAFSLAPKELSLHEAEAAALLLASQSEQLLDAKSAARQGAAVARRAAKIHQ